MSTAIYFFLGAIAFLIVLMIIFIVNICTLDEEEKENNPLGKGKIIFYKENDEKPLTYAESMAASRYNALNSFIARDIKEKEEEDVI